MLLALILELSHTGELAEHCIAIEHPAKLRVCGHVGLNEECILFWIKTARHIECEGLVGSLAKLRRHLSYGDGVKINYAVECFIVLGETGEVLYCAEVISYCEVSGGLNAGENHLFIAVHIINPFGYINL